MEALSTYAKIALLLCIYFILSFGYQGLTTLPTEGDSVAYHIPLAQSILDGSVVNPSREGYGLGFYPGTAEVILAAFQLVSLPLNLYNVIGWGLLVVLCYLLARVYSLNSQISIVYALSSTAVLSAIRLVNNQTIDIWLAVFFTWSLVLLKKPRTSLIYFVTLGIATGLLIGSKYSGPFYTLLVLAVFFPALRKILSVRSFIVFLIPVSILGLSWYLRNFLLTGSPLYPQGFGPFPGNASFHLMDWVGWKTVLLTPVGGIHLLASLFQEYLPWFMIPILSLIWLGMYRSLKAAKYVSYRELASLSLCSFILFFFLPSTADNIVTYLRYLLPAYIPGILLLFLICREKKWLEYLLPLAIINALCLITYTGFHPKIIGVFLVISVLVILKYDILMKYLK